MTVHERFAPLPYLQLDYLLKFLRKKVHLIKFLFVIHFSDLMFSAVKGEWSVFVLICRSHQREMPF